MIFSLAVYLIMQKGLAWRKDEREYKEEGMEEKGEKKTGHNKEQENQIRDMEEKIQRGDSSTGNITSFQVGCILQGGRSNILELTRSRLRSITSSP